MKSFEGSCIVEVFNGRKTIILSVQEIVVTGPTYPGKVVCDTDSTSESEAESSSEGESSEEENEKLLESKSLKIFNFMISLKMPNNAPLTIENFEVEKLRAKTFESKKNGDVTYFAIPFDYDGEDPLIKIKGNFRVFKHVNADRINHSLAISIDDENEEFFSELGCRIATLACENKGKTAKLKSLKPSDLELIKTFANDKYRNVYARIYTNSTGRGNCKLSERKKVKGVFKKRKLKIGDLVDESFKGSCVIRVYQVYVGSSKTIMLSVEEIMATKLTLKAHTLTNMRR